MGFHTIPNTDIEYGLIVFDANGDERPENSGLMSGSLIEKAKADAVTDVFFFCHGWKGDLEAAQQQYENWILAFATSKDQEQATEFFPNFKPSFIGLHWPSLPFGDEELHGGAFGAAGGTLGPEVLVQKYIARLGDSPRIRSLLDIIINEARRKASPEELPPHIKQAYLDLNNALGLKSDGVAGSPDADREGFDPEDSYEAASEEGSAFGGGVNLGGILGPLRQLSYWTMKKRARTIGEGGMHNFLKNLQHATVQNGTRIHLMGHSFGTIVVSGMAGGPGAEGPLPRPVDSLVLVQGAVSLWSYGSQIPFGNAGPGYFNRILKDRKILGPIVTTQSRYDDAVGVFYPLASRLKGSASFAGLPEFGAIGAYGIQGVIDTMPQELAMLQVDNPYKFEKGNIYNLDGSQFICHKEGASGAHSDIAGPEVAHAIWAAAFASVPASAVTAA